MDTAIETLTDTLLASINSLVKTLDQEKADQILINWKILAYTADKSEIYEKSDILSAYNTIKTVIETSNLEDINSITESLKTLAVICDIITVEDPLSYIRICLEGVCQDLVYSDKGAQRQVNTAYAKIYDAHNGKTLLTPKETKKFLNTINDCIEMYRENLIPEGSIDYDEEYLMLKSSFNQISQTLQQTQPN